MFTIKSLKFRKDSLVINQELQDEINKRYLSAYKGIVDVTNYLIENEENDSEKREMLQVIIRNVGYMKSLVINTLELACLNSPNTQFNFEDTNLFQEVNKAIENNKLIFNENHNITWVNNVHDDIIIKADKLRLEELFNNLFNNAIKHSLDVGTITIDAIQNKDHITVSIRDTGRGMTEEQLGKVFDEFYKADLSRHDFESSGLGMSICKRIVEKHGGRIWAESKGLGKGCTFYFTLKPIIYYYLPLFLY